MKVYTPSLTSDRSWGRARVGAHCARIAHGRRTDDGMHTHGGTEVTS